LEDAVRSHDEAETVSTPERQRANVAAHEHRSVPQPCASQSLPCTRQHGCGAVDADERRARRYDRQRDSTSSAAELENRIFVCRGKPPPERHITPGNRL
jgi:hypothetical protein